MSDNQPWVAPDAPTGIGGPRAGVWCGGSDCPRKILVARTLSRLDQLIRLWRCPRCERPAI